MSVTDNLYQISKKVESRVDFLRRQPNHKQNPAQIEKVEYELATFKDSIALIIFQQEQIDTSRKQLAKFAPMHYRGLTKPPTHPKLQMLLNITNMFLSCKQNLIDPERIKAILTPEGFIMKNREMGNQFDQVATVFEGRLKELEKEAV